jgi:hypothetical protein
MANQIIQRPKYSILPVGQDIIFTITNDSVLANYYNVKIIAEVFIDNTFINFTTTPLAGTFKITPNNAGSAIFNFRPVLESFVKPSNTGFNNLQSVSSYKTVAYEANNPQPIHLIDKYCLNTSLVKYFAVKFTIEGSTEPNGTPIKISGNTASSSVFNFFDGYVKQDDPLTNVGGDVGLDIAKFYTSTYGLRTALSNAPTTQSAKVGDYGTLAFIDTDRDINKISLKYYNAAGILQDSENVVNSYLFGGIDVSNGTAQERIFFYGAFPANLRNWSTKFQALVTAGTIQGGYYTIQGLNVSGSDITALYRINVLCDDLKNYESIRLTWLNQWGTWDYYTFTKKSVKSISTSKSTYNQLQGTWNEKFYQINGYKGGKKNFRVNAVEKITINTDFVSETETEWFEELINSTEVYVVNSFDDIDDTATITNKYIEPVRLMTSSYTKKTIANDKLIQYTFEVEKSKTQRTQSV